MESTATKYIAVVKGEQKYIFRYSSGDEPVLLRRALEYAKDPSCNLDWEDVVLFIRRLRDMLLEDMPRDGASESR